jgi:hypothetical protein
MPKKLYSMLFAAVGITAVLAGTQTAAQAKTYGGDSDVEWVRQDTASGYCNAWADERYSPDNYVRAHVSNAHAGWSCTGWLERTTDWGLHWYRASGYHTVASQAGDINYAETGDYWNGAGYLARACFKLNFSGAANHCTSVV